MGLFDFFKKKRTLTDETIISFQDAERLSLIKNKATVVITTYSSHLKAFMLSVLSVLINSKSDDMIEHIIVSINGPDERNRGRYHGLGREKDSDTLDQEHQDKKQAFLEDLRRMKWGHRGMPLTVQRVWSRIGHAQSLEAALPWVHTEYYLTMHDDVWIVKEDWLDHLRPYLEEEDFILANVPPILHGYRRGNVMQYPNFKMWEGKPVLRFPHLNTAFVFCNKHKMNGLSWMAHHMKVNINLKDHPAFMDNFKIVANGIEEGDHPINEPFTDEYNWMSVDIGGWIFQALKNQGYRFRQISPSIITHLKAMSYNSEIDQHHNLNRNDWAAEILENRMKQYYPQYYDLYYKHLSLDKKSKAMTIFA